LNGPERNARLGRASLRTITDQSGLRGAPEQGPSWKLKKRPSGCQPRMTIPFHGEKVGIALGEFIRPSLSAAWQMGEGKTKKPGPDSVITTGHRLGFQPKAASGVSSRRGVCQQPARPPARGDEASALPMAMGSRRANPRKSSSDRRARGMTLTDVFEGGRPHVRAD